MSDTANRTDAAESTIDRLLDEVLAGSNLYRVETRLKGSAHQPMVDVFIDGDSGVTIDECAMVSRSLRSSIDLEDLFPGGFKLDVSSPGLGRPLLIPRQYKRHIGRRLELVLSDEEAPRAVAGKLVDTADTGITIEEGDHEVELRFEQIESAVVTPTW